jgi:Protein of unknown function (DUF1580)
MSNTFIPLRDVPKLSWIPNRRCGSRLNPSTLWRWSVRGIRGYRLQTWCIGETRVTTEAAMLEFFRALAGTVPALPSIGTLYEGSVTSKGPKKGLVAEGI